jgi:diacylglycerol kinase family enzyme
MRRVLIVNPAASGVTQSRITAVMSELAAGGPIEKLVSERPGHAAELAAQACRESEAIYIFAGDGGFNEAVNGMRGSVPIGFLPGGATNVLPRALGLPRDPVDCARLLAPAARTRRISLGRVKSSPTAPLPPRSPTGRRFTFAAGVGLDAEVVRAVDRRGRKRGRRPGDLAFVSELTRLLSARGWRLEPALTVKDHGRAAFAIVANCDPYTYAGPLRVRAAPLARFDLGLDLVAPLRVDPGGVAKLVWWVLARPSHPRSPDVVYVHDADRVEVRCDVPMPLEVDGEDLGDVTEAIFEAERSALTVLV